jgi:hypothetical protein
MHVKTAFRHCSAAAASLQDTTLMILLRFNRRNPFAPHSRREAETTANTAH